MQTTHPDELDLELYRTGEAEPQIAAHLEGCADCTARLDQAVALAEILAAPVPPIEIPAERDAAILEWAGRQARSIRPPPRLAAQVRWMAPLAAAAAIAAVLLVPRVMTVSAPELSAVRGDINGDGVVDIRDALALATAVDAGATLSPSWDLTGEGRVDREDVERVAFAAVRVGGTVQ